MIDIDFAGLDVGAAYKLQIGSIVPRPIAWVSTIDRQGIANLAPFSYFNGVCSNPPALLFCPVNHPDGREKDTLRNVRATGEFVVNIASEPLVRVLNQTAAEYPASVDEFAAAGATPIASTIVKAPRVAESPIQFECVLLDVVDVGVGPHAGHVVIGRIVYGHFDPAVYRDGHIALDALKPLARYAGTTYGPVRDTFELPKPTV